MEVPDWEWLPSHGIAGLGWTNQGTREEKIIRRALDFRCPSCGAKPGKPCLGKTASRRKATKRLHGVHDARRVKGELALE